MLIDAHAHLDLHKRSLDQALHEIERHRILTLSNSTGLESYRRNREIARRSAWILPTFGVHPWYAPEYAGRLADLDEAIAESPMLGEIGLDYLFVKDASQHPAQREVFEYLLAAAGEQDKIVTVHSPGAERDVLRLLRRHEIKRAIVHWYCGPLEMLPEFLDCEFYFTVGVEVLRSNSIRAVARALPDDRMLTETDHPGGWKWLTGERGMPCQLLDVIRAVADVRQSDPESISQLAIANLASLIGGDPLLADVGRRLSAEDGTNTDLPEN